MTVAVLGDIGGHAEELYTALVGLGMNPSTLTLPQDLIVVQVGDLVHKGPNSLEVCLIVDSLIRSGSWVQLLGNHEAWHLGGYQFSWPGHVDELPEGLNDAAVSLLHSWHEEGLLKVSASVDTGDGERLLITHAGLTRGFWMNLNNPQTPEAASSALNSLLYNPSGWPLLNEYGVLLGGKHVNLSAGPLWADAGSEVYASWNIGGSVPFGQVHGHSSLVHWSTSRVLLPSGMEDLDVYADRLARQSKVSLGGRNFWGIDPSFGTEAGVPWLPLVFPSGTLL